MAPSYSQGARGGSVSTPEGSCRLHGDISDGLTQTPACYVGPTQPLGAGRLPAPTPLTVAGPSAAGKARPLPRSLSRPVIGGVPLLLELPGTPVPAARRGDPEKSQHRPWTDTHRPPPPLLGPRSTGTPLWEEPHPTLLGGPQSSLLTALCHWRVPPHSCPSLPSHVRPSISRRRLRWTPAHRGPSILHPAPPRSHVAGLPLGDMESHLGVSCVIPETLWHAGGGADTGRGEAGKTGNQILLAASSRAVWGASGCCQCHAGAGGG